MKNLKLCLLALLFINVNIFSQEKGINLVNKKTNKTIFIKENLRTKVKTIDGITFVGNLKIIDKNTINIDGTNISIQSIIKIRHASMFHAIADPIAIVFGGILLSLGVYSMGSVGFLSGIDSFFFIPGIPTFVVPFIKNNHPVEKFEYQIQN